VKDFTISNSIYNQLPLDSDIQLFRVDGLDIPFNLQWRKIGINLSGGADSALLLTVLCKIIADNKIDCDVHAISHVRCWDSRPWQGPIALDVYNKFVADYPTIKFERHTNYIPPELEWGVLGPITTDDKGRQRSGDQIAVGSFNKYIMFKEKFDSVFNATSANPAGSNWIGGMKDREKPASEGTLEDLVMIKKQHSMCHPFRFVDKSWIVRQYHKLGKLDLYNMTRSCEGDLGNKDIKAVVPNLESYDPALHTIDKLPKCGECWWCKEREWADSNV
jgi:hypothetical protein